MTYLVDRRSFSLMLAAGAAMVGRAAMAGTDAWMGDAFRDEVIAIGRRHFPDMPFAPGRGVVLSGDHTLYLQNVYAGVQGLGPADREAAIVRWLSRFTPAADVHAEAIKTAADSWEGARPLLRLRLMNRATAAIAPRILKEPFSPELSLAFTIDLGDKDLYVADERFARWKVSQSDVRAAATANLEAMSAAVPVTAASMKGKAGRYVLVDSGDGYDAARLALPAFRKKLMGALGDAFFAAVPARDLMICWSMDFEAQETMVRVVEEDEARMPHALTTEMFLVAGDGLHPMRAVLEP